MATRAGRRRAVGCSVHTGWAMLVAVAGPAPAPAILTRRRIELVGDRKTAHVYHAAKEMPLAEATKFVDRASGEALAKAIEAFDALTADVGQDAPLAAVGIVEGNSILPSSLEAILRSHALIHTAEGVLFRRALDAAARRSRLAVVGVPSKQLHARASAEIGVEMAALPAWLAERGRAVGRPWGRDEKDALLVACVALAAD